MKLRYRTRRGHPAGFTLIELLVVIAIIAVLVGLVTAAIIKVKGKGPQVVTRTEMGNMEVAIQSILTERGGTLNFIPSSFTLREDGVYSAANASHRLTVRVLTALFGKSCVSFTSPVPIDWNGDGTISKGVEFTLEGEECLVFFLGGIPSAGATVNCLGFSNNPSNPAAVGGAHRGPYFPFDASRLARSTRASAPNFLVYQDPYNLKVPYAYFSNYGAGNDYVSTDCASLGVQPFFYKNTVGGTTNFINPTSCQIISAGRDGKFGPGGNTWTTANGYTGTSQAGMDDQSNFSTKLLASGSQN